MTWPEFSWDVTSNTIATLIGIAGGVPAALWVERRRQRAVDAVDAEARAAEVQRAKRRRQEKLEAKAERRRAEMVALARALDLSLELNVSAIDKAAAEVSGGKIAMYSEFDLFTWQSVHARVLDLLRDPLIVGRMSRFFASLQAFDRLVDMHMRVPPHSRNIGLQDRIVQMGPELREEANAIRAGLQRRLLLRS